MRNEVSCAAMIVCLMQFLYIGFGDWQGLFSQCVAIFAYYLFIVARNFLFFRAILLRLSDNLFFFNETSQGMKAFPKLLVLPTFDVTMDSVKGNDQIISNQCTDQSVRDRFLTGVIK